MSDSQSKEESEEKSKSFANQAHGTDNDLSNKEIMYEIIVAGGEFRKSVEHILLPATLQIPKEKNILKRLRSAILPRKSSNSVQKWTYLQSMRTRREGFMTGIYKDQMFAFGGLGSGLSFESLDLNDPLAQWQYRDRVFQQDLWHSAAVVYGESAYIFGGNFNGPSSNIYRLSLVPPYTVELIGQMPEPRSYHNAEIFDDKVIILCGSSRGCGRDVEWLDTVLQYDITTNSFKTLPPLPAEIIFSATATWKDNVVIVGGVSKGFDIIDPVWLYNISSGESQRLPPMIQERRECAAVVAGDILVVLGGTSAGIGTHALAECYNFMTNKWTELPPMKQERRFASALVRCWDAEKALAYKAPHLDEKSCRRSNPELVW